MDRNEQIEELLVDWEMARLDGTPKSAAELCAEADCPELIDELRKRIAILEQTSWIFESTSLDRGQSVVAPEPVPKQIDRYEILGEVGQGGMGTVYRARHTSMNREVAIKTLSRSTLSDTRRERFLREIQTIASLNHPNIVTAYDALEHDGESYLVMELVDGEDLESLVKREGPLAGEQVNRIAAQIASAAQAAHEKGIIHRDIKPSNILLSKKGKAKLLDLGISRIQTELWPDGEGSVSSSATITQDNVPIGTVAFMSPEQALDAKTADARSDVYSLGCTLYWLLSGKPLVGSENSIQTIVGHRELDIKPLVESLDIEPNDKTRLVKMLAKDPADRFQSMQEVADSYQPIQTLQRSDAANSLGGRKPLILMLASLVLAGLAGLFAFSPGWISAITGTGQSAESKLERDFARWILNRQGMISADTALGTQEIDSVEGLPSGPFNITEIYLVAFHDDFSLEALLPLKKLNSLHLVECSLAPVETDCMASMEKLESLSFETCDLPASFWSEVAKAPALKSLSLSNCSEPEERSSWPKLPTLESFSSNSSWFDDEDLKQMGDLPSLKTLTLNETEVGEGALRFAVSHPRLEDLDLSYNKLAEVDFSKLPVSQSLKTFFLMDAGRPNGMVEYLAKLPVLTELYLDGSVIHDKDLELLSKCPKLEHLDVAGTKVTSAGLAVLKEFPSLQSLDVARLNLSDDDVEVISKLDLNELSLSGNVLTTDSLDFLMDTPLQLIDVSDCNLPADVLGQFLADHPTCETVIDDDYANDELD